MKQTIPTLPNLQSEYIRAISAGSPSAQYWKEEILSFRPVGADMSDWVWDNIESLPLPDPSFKGLVKRGSLGKYRGYFYREFPNGAQAFEVQIFGRLSLPEGVSILNAPLSLSVNAGGNNESRRSVLPEGTQVAYYSTGGQVANLLWADIQAP